MAAVGSSRRRLEGRSKVSGRTRFTADLQLPGLAHVRLVLSPHACARIAGVDLEAARRAPGVLAVVAGSDLPAMRVPGPDLPLARERTWFAGQPVVAVVAETEGQAEDAAALVEVEYEPLPAVVDLFDAIAEGAPRVLGDMHSVTDDSGAHGTAIAAATTEDRHHNVTAAVRFQRGDAAGALAASAHVVTGRWRLAAVHQGFIEPHVAIGQWEPEGEITVWTPTQGQFLTREETAVHLGVPTSSVRVVPMPVGGGFGGKVRLLEPLVALLSHAAGGRPVRLELTRTEEHLMGRGGPGAVVDLELGCDAEGRLTGLRSRAWFDNGAGQGGLAGLAGLMLCGAYRLAAHDFEGTDVATNKTPVAAYRAPGAPQAFFALEGAVDELARAAGLDPIEFRLRNAAREGDPRPDGQQWPRIGFVECLEAARAHPLYTAPRSGGEGLGVAAGAWGGGREPAAAACRVETDGTLNLFVGYADISGTDTTMAMLAAESFGLPVDSVRVVHGDTANSPYAGMAGGSKTVYTVGPAVVQAAQEARRQLLEIAADELEAAVEDLVIEDGRVQVAGVPGRAMEIGRVAKLAAQFGGRHRPVLGQGRTAITSQAPMFTVQLCRVRRDAETGEYRLTGFAAVQDVGRAINPAEVEGQIHGGTLQALGRALGEQLAYGPEGELRTATFADYELPTVDQVPPFDVVLLEIPSIDGPMGAKGVGEPPAVPGPAAVANALRDAGAAPLRDLPIAWEAVAAGLPEAAAAG